MKFTCLSEGGGYHFPSCHILNVCGFWILLDCPLDLSLLTVFWPIHADSCPVQDEKTSVSSSHTTPLVRDILIHGMPCYKTIQNLHLWNTSFIDLVLVSSPMGMLGLPFLTRTKGFSAKVYATEATIRLAQLLMEDLVTMHMEFSQFYGPEDIDFPKWMKWEELEMIPSELKERVVGQDGAALGGWMALYSAGDVKDCMDKVQALKFAEETCYNGSLTIKAFSSGLEIGACNWTICGPKRNIAYLSGFLFASEIAMNYDYHALQGSDVIIFSDFSNGKDMGHSENKQNCSSLAPNNLSLCDRDDNLERIAVSLLNSDNCSEEMEKLDFICSHSLNSVKSGGSVLIAIGRLGIVLQLLERMSLFLESSDLKVPIFVISSVAEELLAFSSIIPEWLCRQRQEKLYSGQPLFAFAELLKQKRVYLFPAIHSVKLLSMWQEPCIVFCPHWSMRLGPVVHLLKRWHGDPNSLLVMEEGVDVEMALLPFKPMSMKVLQCSFLSGIKLQTIQPLLRILQPKYALFPRNLRWHIDSLESSFSFDYYSGNETLCIPNLRKDFEMDIATDLASQLQLSKLNKKDMNIARLKGKLSIEQGKHRLLPMDEHCSQTNSVMHWGTVDVETLVATLRKMGITGSIEQRMSNAGSENCSMVHIFEPNKALIEVQATRLVISTADESLACLISKAICGILDVI